MENIENNVLSPYQMQILELLSKVNSQEEMNDIRLLLAHYFAEKAQKEIDKMWDDGIINDEVIEGWKHEHMRTPYRR